MVENGNNVHSISTMLFVREPRGYSSSFTIGNTLSRNGGPTKNDVACPVIDVCVIVDCDHIGDFLTPNFIQ